MENLFGEYPNYYKEYIFFLKKYSEYYKDSVEININDQILSSTNTKLLQKFPKTEKGFSVETEIDLIGKVMNWLFAKLANSEQNMNLEKKVLDVLYTIKNKEINCYVRALALTEMLSYCGFYTRTVRCLPIGTFPYDNHCVTAIYLTSIKKWIVVDPTYNLFFKDDNGVYLSLSEIREKLIQEQKIHVIFNRKFKFTNIKHIEEQYLFYMSKNLFRFRVNAFLDNENIQYELVPRGYLPENYAVNLPPKMIITTTDVDKFWEIRR